MAFHEPRRVAVVGLGYAGLPIAAALARTVPTVGFDVSEERVQELMKGHDRNHDIRPEDLLSPSLTLTTDPGELARCDVVIVVVPTPVDHVKRPDFSHLLAASRTVGQALAARARAAPADPPAVVVFESTVYPGCTEEVCVPAIEQASGLRAGQGFKVGYSPERINPGDKAHTLETVVKVVAGQDAETTELLAGMYGKVVKAGVYKAPNIRTAEAEKVIENTQRDLNIALMNELSILFHKLGIDTLEVLKAAETKWNFLPFRPGLVGGHCIPEDPYYLTHKAQEVGYHPSVILAGRRINDGMGVYVAQETVKALIHAGRKVQGARALVLGLSYKEDVADTRNTRVVEMVRELESYGVTVETHDPVVGAPAAERLGVAWAPDPFGGMRGRARYDAVVLAVPHRAFRERPPEAFLGLLRADGGPGAIIDLKGALPRDAVRAAGASYWRL